MIPNQWKRLACLMLAVLLLCSYVPAVTLAADTDGLCPHHTEHTGCSYVAPMEGSPCTHSHDDTCFQEVTACIHAHDENCGYCPAVSAADCTHRHDESCGYSEENPSACTHIHDESCGYNPGTEGTACSHSCSAESQCITSQPACTHTHGENCGYAEAVAEVACDFVCQQCTVAPTAPSEGDPVPMAEGNVGSGTPDSTPPTLNSITLSATTVTPNSTIEITLDASDNVSGVESADITFYCAETKKELHVNVYAYYWDDYGNRYAYEDGKLHGELKIDQYVETGTFLIEYLHLYDVADNHIFYHRDDINYAGDNSAVMPESVLQLTFSVVENTTPDSTPPTLNSIILSATTVTPNSTIEITLDASDNVSGVESADITFYCAETKKELHASVNAYYWDDYGNRYAYEDGKLHGELKIDQYVETGTFLIEYLHLYDVADNHIFYHRDDINYAGDNSAVMPESVLQTQFAVEENPTFDSIPPVLNNITLSVNQITAPGVVSVTLDATDNLSGIDSADITFYCPKTKKELHTYVGAYYWDNSGNRYVYEDGKLHGELTLDQYVETGDFQIKYLFLYDVANNYIYYHRTDNYYGDDFNSVMPDNVLNLTLSVFNTTPDVTTSVNKDTFLHEVTQAQGDAYIVADYSGSTTLSQDVFDAIAGTDKTLDLTSDGITWRFEGSDIINPPKDIELNVTITKVEDEGSEYGESIEENLQGNPGVVMKFAENGQLPGKATIQIKVDYAMREYLGSGKGLSVYYFNNQTQKLELIAQDLIVINDTYVEFPITHCSYYVLTIDLDMPKNRVYLDMHELSYCSSVWIDGKEYAITSDNGDSYVDLPDSNASFLVTYSYHTGNSSDVHTQYPLSMKVWRLHNTNGYYRTSYVPDLDNILQYSGSSIRITGVKGIRMITSVDAGKKSALTGSGLSGYKLLEYGTVLSWASDLEGGNPLVLGQPYAKSNYAYKRNVADPVFQYAGNLIQYTNVLVGFDLDQCKDDIAMRSYMILETPEGGQATVYGGIVYRSIGYIAWQNRTVFIPGTDAYNYVWEIIHHVYGDQYDADYEG